MLIKRSFLIFVTALIFIFIFNTNLLAAKTESPLNSETFKGLQLRNIGPALMSGRIADIDIAPNNKNIWIVGVGSGGVWKTVNAGTTWTPLFDDQNVYSIGTVTIDPNNSSTIWVGTGENVSGRHVGFGDGVYVSHDGGISWQNMGLKNSEHISEIIVHPTNPKILWVASQGPLWSKGGERGVYKTVDGGNNWKRVLGDNQWVGATDLLIDPRNPDRLYAATWQRHRTVAALLDGGEGSGIHRSEDGGETWIQLNPATNTSKKSKQSKSLSNKSGLPESKMGKIGLALSPQNPDVLYAAIELNRRKGAVYKSTNRGASWSKQSDAVGGGTGPHYYQELYASPHQFDQIFLAGPGMQQSNDGGKTFFAMNEEHKHGDNHSLAFLDSDKNYMLMGSDGGIYESFDKGNNWRFISNLPITQYYKVAVDDAAPFYNIYGGTQDNGTQGGPSRTDNRNGIRNSDWEMVLFADGHQPATEPGNPNIMYAEWQQGNLVRVDRTNGELVFIQPQPDPGDPEERFNWDAPILVSPHKSTRLYHASQRVWRSEDRGDTWTAISGDLTKNLDRIEQPIMDKKPGWDAAWDMWAMSNYSTITSLAESPKKQGLIYAGSDDGLIHITENGGKNWRKVDVGSLPGVPNTAFVNDIKADLFDRDTVYIALDNHKFGDYKPYLLKSTNKGKSWKSISSNLPEKHLVWRVVQDHVKKELMFAATEFGVFFTINAGKNWVELNGGVPTISFRDITIQRRENDLILASFGRGFFVLDDYSSLREISEASLKTPSQLFTPRDALWYIEQGPLSRFEPKGSQGAAHYHAENPNFGATFTYYLNDSIKSLKQMRQAKESKMKPAESIAFPGWKTVESERREQQPQVWLTVKDSSGEVVRRVKGSNNKGINRVSWDLSIPSSDAITKPEAVDDQSYIQIGFLSSPGNYSVELSQQVRGESTLLAAPKTFKVNAINPGSLEGASHKKVASFWKELSNVKRDASATYFVLEQALEKMKMLSQAVLQSKSAPGGLDKQLSDIRSELHSIDHQLNGDSSRFEVYLSNEKTVNNWIGVAELGTAFSTYGPTPTHVKSLQHAKAQLLLERDKLNQIIRNKIPALEKGLRESGAPWVKNQALD
ncbi:MAG: hypothetical protein KUG78_20325 [Kangiellaceae bacterium]|nr:hypothetical protein [Kangiellaceae bacterium]